MQRLLLTCADTLTTLPLRKDEGSARLASNDWHCPGCTRTDVVCMLVTDESNMEDPLRASVWVDIQHKFRYYLSP